jgi:tripartite-type tricarboxylate transporter receptor subunit TctC
MPAEVVQKINQAVADTVNDPAVKKRLVEEGSEIRIMSPGEFGQFIRKENARWVKVVKEAGIKPQ